MKIHINSDRFPAAVNIRTNTIIHMHKKYKKHKHEVIGYLKPPPRMVLLPSKGLNTAAVS